MVRRFYVAVFDQNLKFKYFLKILTKYIKQVIILSVEVIYILEDK